MAKGERRAPALYELFLQPVAFWEIEKMSFLFQLFLLALVVVSFLMVVGVPVAYASPSNWDVSKRLIFIGSGVWVALVVIVGLLNYLVV